MSNFQNNISRPYYGIGFTGYYKGGPLRQPQRVDFWPIKAVAYAYERGHQAGMTLPHSLNL